MNAPLGWFDGYGIELEWMLVNASTLDVEPVADQVLRELAGKDAMEVECGPVAWSNELALHVIEMKTNGPTPDLERGEQELFAALQAMLQALQARGAQLMPTGMHPWMNPESEFRLWPTDEEGIYGTFDRIFDCRGHGWSNLQSMHINLPFADDQQFAALHDAVRCLLPLLPALAASSPFVEGRLCANLDQRFFVYRGNAAKVREVTGQVVPPRVASHADYERQILQPIYRALEPYDPEGILRHEWVNARGAIARFDRMAIEIRLLDAQESVRSNLAIAHGIVEVLRQSLLAAGPQLVFTGTDEQLLAILEQTARDGDRAPIADGEYLTALGLDTEPTLASDVWRRLFERVSTERRSAALWPTLELIVEQGCLARRIIAATGADPDAQRLHDVYRALSDCLKHNTSFVP